LAKTNETQEQGQMRRHRAKAAARRLRGCLLM
jgi:hypothetical protein